MVATDFNEEVLPVSGKLLRYATWFLNDGEEARDVVQDVFMKLWQRRDELDGIENIEAFALRMTRNRCLDVIRKKRVIANEVSSKGASEEPVADIVSRIELSETAMQVRNLINRLPDLQKKIMVLRDIEQFSYGEIEELTGLNANAVRVNLSRARKKVRDELMKSEGNGNYGNKKNFTAIL